MPFTRSSRQHASRLEPQILNVTTAIWLNEVGDLSAAGPFHFQALVATKTADFDAM